MEILGKKFGKDQPTPKPVDMAFAMGVVIPQPPDALGRAQLTAIVQAGMTLRDYFAAQALQGMRYNAELNDFDTIARLSYAMADKMLEIRAVTSDKG